MSAMMAGEEKKKTPTEVVFWQQALETIAKKITAKEVFERELDIKFEEPRGCEGAGGAAAGGA